MTTHMDFVCVMTMWGYVRQFQRMILAHVWHEMKVARYIDAVYPLHTHTRTHSNIENNVRNWHCLRCVSIGCASSMADRMAHQPRDLVSAITARIADNIICWWQILSLLSFLFFVVGGPPTTTPSNRYNLRGENKIKYSICCQTQSSLSSSSDFDCVFLVTPASLLAPRRR